MRRADLFSLLAATYLMSSTAEAQNNAVPGPPPPQVAASAGNRTAAQDMLARPDAARYYWQNGQWWYYTPQSTWLRWNGAVWLQHVNPNYVPPQPSQVRSSRANSYEPISPPSYRYSINERRGGL